MKSKKVERSFLDVIANEKSGLNLRVTDFPLVPTLFSSYLR